MFLDRDGVINEPVLDARSGRHESPYRPEDVSLIAGVADAIAMLRGIGATIVIVSNQPAAAKGTASLDDLLAVHDEVARQLAAAGVQVDDARYCFHHPDGAHPQLGGPCGCRKPGADMLLDAAAELGIHDLSTAWIVGDSDVDILAGQLAGVQTVLVEEPRSAHRRSGASVPDHRVPSVVSAAALIASACAPLPPLEDS